MIYYISFNNKEKVVRIHNFDHTIKRTERDDSPNEFIIYQFSALVEEDYHLLLGTFEKYYKSNSISSIAIIDENDNVIYDTTIYTEMFAENLIMNPTDQNIVYTLTFEKEIALPDDEEEEEENI